MNSAADVNRPRDRSHSEMSGDHSPQQRPESPSLSSDSKRRLISDPLQLSAAEMRILLQELDVRLRKRGLAASVYVVGGAALVLTGDRDQLTPDIDALTTSPAVREEAVGIADHYGLPTSWLNSNAAPYVPPRPEEYLEPPTKPGLTVHIAPPTHLLAMKIVASRSKDRADIERLLTKLDMEDSSAADFARLLADVYKGEDRVADALGVPGSDPETTKREALRLGEAIVQVARTAKGRRGV